MSDDINEFPEDLLKELTENGYLFLRIIPGKGICGLSKMLYTVGVVYGLDYFGYDGRYCYGSWAEAALALVQWNGQGDPPGKWIVHKGKGGDIQNPEREKEIYGRQSQDSAN